MRCQSPSPGLSGPTGRLRGHSGQGLCPARARRPAGYHAGSIGSPRVNVALTQAFLGACADANETDSIFAESANGRIAAVAMASARAFTLFCRSRVLARAYKLVVC